MATTAALYVVAMPLGNPRDVSARAIDTLRDVDAIVAEDTRTAARWLVALGIDRRGRALLSCYDANEAARAEQVAVLLADGRTVALVSEAGTPGVSDPGYRIVRAAVEAGARVVPIPGPSAAVTALSASGLPTDRFAFVGFPPRGGSALATFLDGLRRLPMTLVLYESPRRVPATLAALREAFGNRPACLARELTKPHEELVRGTLGDLAERYANERPLGEVTIVIGGAGAETLGEDSPASDDDVRQNAEALLAAGQSARDVVTELAASLGRPRRDVYRIVNGLRAAKAR